MFTRLRKHLGTAGLLVAVVALVAALGGGAVAAQSGGDATASAKKKKKAAPGLNAKQKRQVRGIARGLVGTGPAGPAGPAGQNGAPGANGQDGAAGTSVTGVAATVGECPDGGVKYTSASGDNVVCNGADGNDGGDGASGTNGTSATVVSEPRGDNCTEGGIKVSSASPDRYVCNGSPWTAGGTLPRGATLTGTYAVAVSGGASPAGYDSISFPLPLAGNIPLANIHLLSADDVFFGSGLPDPEGPCFIGGGALITARPNHICILVNDAAGNATVARVSVLSPLESLDPNFNLPGLIIKVTGAEGDFSVGSWSVTAPTS